MNSLLKGLWRLVQPVRSYWHRYPLQLIPAFFRFLISFRRYQQMGGNLSLRWIAPVLSFRGEDTQTGGGHYFFQDIWALRQLLHFRPKLHYDIGSRLDGFVGQATAFCPVTYIDLRPPSFHLSKFTFLQGDILHLPFQDNSIESMSCLHTIEHIGLGRYGDAINPEGFNQALNELQRVIKPGGILLLSMPVGIPRIEFNAQRVLDPVSCINALTAMCLLEFSVVNDQNEFAEKVNPELYRGARYSCGLYTFQKK